MNIAHIVYIANKNINRDKILDIYRYILYNNHEYAEQFLNDIESLTGIKVYYFELKTPQELLNKKLSDNIRDLISFKKLLVSYHQSSKKMSYNSITIALQLAIPKIIITEDSTRYLLNEVFKINIKTLEKELTCKRFPEAKSITRIHGITGRKYVQEIKEILQVVYIETDMINRILYRAFPDNKGKSWKEYFECKI